MELQVSIQESNLISFGYPTCVWLILEAPVLLCPYLSLCVTALLVSEQVEPKWVLHVVPQKAGEAGLSHLPPFPARRTLSSWGVPLSTEQCWPGDGMLQQNEAVLPSLFVQFFSSFFVLLCLQTFLNGPLSSPRAVFLCG